MTKEQALKAWERAEKERQEWREWYYGEYLHSEEWAHKREKVLRRDQYICQGCLKAEATVVHHLSYGHVELQNAQEFCFELISLCQECHEQVHHLKEETL